MTNYKGWMLDWWIPLNSDSNASRDSDLSTFSSVVDLLGRGDLRFIDYPLSPPFELIEFLERKLEVSTRIMGIQIEDPAYVQLVQQNVFSSGFRQNYLFGYELHWFDGLPGLRALIADQLGDFSGQIDNLLCEVHWLSTQPFNRNRGTLRFREKHVGSSWAEYRAQVAGLEFELDVHGARMQETDKAWLEFSIALVRLLKQIEEFTRRVLSENRIIVSETRSDRSVFTPGRAVNTDCFDEDLEFFSFASTANLPAAIFRSNNPNKTDVATSGARAIGRPRGLGYLKDDEVHFKELLKIFHSLKSPNKSEAVRNLLELRGEEIKGATHQAKFIRFSNHLRLLLE